MTGLPRCFHQHKNSSASRKGTNRPPRSHPQGSHPFPVGAAGTGSTRDFTDSSDKAEFISTIKDRKLQSIATEKLGAGPPPSSMRLEQIPDGAPPPMIHPSHHDTSSAMGKKRQQMKQPALPSQRSARHGYCPRPRNP